MCLSDQLDEEQPKELGRWKLDGYRKTKLNATTRGLCERKGKIGNFNEETHVKKI